MLKYIVSKIKDNKTMMTSQKVAQPMAAVASYSTSHSEVQALDCYKTTRSKPLQTHLLSLLEVGCRKTLITSL